MVVSGLPEKVKNHAGEIASMSLHLLKEIKEFKIRHRPEDTIKLRIGIHSGTFDPMQCPRGTCKIQRILIIKPTNVFEYIVLLLGEIWCDYGFNV